MAKAKTVNVKTASVLSVPDKVMKNVCVERETLQKEIANLKNSIADIEKESFKLEVDALPSPVTFGSLKFATQPEASLSESQKERYRNASLMKKHELHKILGGLRTIDYEADPERFIVELNVTNKCGEYVKPSYVTVNQISDGGYKIGPCRLPHVRILSVNKEKYSLDNKNQVKLFLKKLAICCEAYEDRRVQVHQLKERLDPDTITVFHDNSYEYLEVAISVSGNAGCKLRVFYHMHQALPHDYKIISHDLTYKLELESKFVILKKLTLLEAFEVVFLKDETLNAVSEEKRETQLEKTASTKRKIVRNTEFHFSDSSEDDDWTEKRKSVYHVEKNIMSPDKEKGKQMKTKRKLTKRTVTRIDRMTTKVKRNKNKQIETVCKESDSELADSDLLQAPTITKKPNIQASYKSRLAGKVSTVNSVPLEQGQTSSRILVAKDADSDLDSVMIGNIRDEWDEVCVVETP